MPTKKTPVKFFPYKWDTFYFTLSHESDFGITLPQSRSNSFTIGKKLFASVKCQHSRTISQSAAAHSGKN